MDKDELNQWLVRKRFYEWLDYKDKMERGD